MIWLLLVLLLLSLVYLFQIYNQSYWKRRNVSGPKPRLFVGNLGELLILKKSLLDIYYEIYNDFKNLPFVGIYRMGTPCLLIRDPELYKCIAVKNFKNFYNNDVEIDKKVDPIFGKNAFALRGAEWKATRSTLTPCFTSQKMRVIFPLLDTIGKRLVKYINDQIDAGESCLETKELSTKTTLENVASCAFGLEGQCFDNPNAEFRQIAQDFLSPGGLQSIKFMLIMMFPALSRLVSFKFVTKDVEERLTKIVTDTVEYREKNKIERQDFLHAMNQLRKTHPEFTMADLVAQASGFFADGYETSSIVMSFLLYELACHPDIQEKLRSEIQSKVKENGGKVTYEMIQEMEYLDACFNENMRKTPIAAILFKACTAPFSHTYSGEYGEHSVSVETGTPVIISLKGMFLDPKYFPQPEKYMPERFLKDSQDPGVVRGIFKPFGDGPRSCLGQKFGILQIKVDVIHILLNFKLSFNSKTKLPLKMDPFYVMPAPIGGLWVNFEKI